MSHERIVLGVHIGQQAMPMAELRSLWRRLDDAGVDWISVWDHLYEAPPANGTMAHHEAVATLGALAADTSDARIGCLVFCAGYRNLGLLAKSAITIDHISNGRFELGIGAGWHEQEANAFGLAFPPLGQRFEMLEEALPLLRDLLRGQRVTHSGTHVRLSEALCTPAPVRGVLPIWIGGTGRSRTPRLAAEHADGWNAAYVGPREFRELNDLVDERCAEVGRPPGSLERAINLMFMLSSGRRSQSPVEQLRDGWGDLAERMAEGALSGGPADVVERCAAYVEAGARQINIVLRSPWDDMALDRYLEELDGLRATLARVARGSEG